MVNDKPSLDSIFCTAIEIESAEQRRDYVVQACGQDAELLRQADRLLQAHFGAGSFLESPPAGAAPSPTIDQPFTEKPGTQIGPYKLLQQIGEGGMGVVYMAEQHEPVRRKVALKIIKPGMDSRQVIARFEAERQALAMMDHPNIAKVIDAGTTDSGRPYFVMELVRGVPITQFCDQRKLTPRQRLELFVPVCQAIQHAHQKGILHRDIKPSNVLVALYDDRAVPKVIDFGLAKATGQLLTDKTLFTNIGCLVGTLEYMSPEQASLNNLDVDTRSDVYSLGVLLYELLTGVTPLDRSSLQQGAVLECLRIVREVEVAAPSLRLSTMDAIPTIAANRGMEPAKLSRFMKGELDWVLLKALEKDRVRRYETVNALARDIERYLADELIEARPPSTAYRLRRLARQHRVALISSLAVALCLIAGAAVSTWQAVRAARAKQAAVRAAYAAHLAQQDAVAKRSEAEQERREAEHQRREAQSQRDEAERQRSAVQVEKLAAQEHLVSSQILLGRTANANGDTAEALTWFHQAYANAPAGDPRRVSARNLIGAWGGNLKRTLVHPGGVHTVAVSADGRTLVGGYFHSHVQAWDIATGAPRGAPWPHAGDVVSAQLSADGGLALIGDWEGAKVWDVATGKLRYPMLEHEVREDTVVGPVLSPDGRTIVTRSPLTGIRLWDAETGQPRGESQPLGTFVYEMFFSPDSKRVAASGSNVARVWDAETARPVGEPFVGATGFAFHPAGQFAAISRQDGSILLHVLDSGEQVAVLPHEKPLQSVAFDAQGRNLLTGDDVNAYLWLDVLKAERTRRVLPHGSNRMTAAFSPTGGWLMTGSPALLRIWKEGAAVPSWEKSVSLDRQRGRGEQWRSARFSPDGKSLLTLTENGSAEVLAVASGRSLARAANVIRAAFAPDGQSLFAGSRDGWMRVHAVEADDGRRLLAPAVTREFCSGSTAALSPDGTLIFVVGQKQSRICRTDTWAPLGDPLEGLYHDYKDMVAAAAFSPDGRLLVTAMSLRGPGATPYFAGSTCRVTFWDVATTKPIGEPLSFAKSTYAILFDATGENVMIGDTVYDVRSRTARKLPPDRIPNGHRAVSQLLGFIHSPAPLLWNNEAGIPTTVALPNDANKQALLSPDGRRLLIVAVDGLARLHDSSTGTPLGPAFRPEGHARERSHDGRYALFGSDNTLRLWDTTLGRPCGDALHNDTAMAAASFSPGGTILATNRQFTMHLWDCATGMPLGSPMEMRSNLAARPLFSPDGRRLLVPSSGLEVWRVPAPAADEPERLRLSIEVRTGLEFDAGSTIQKLSHAKWLVRSRRLKELGGPCDVHGGRN